MDFFSSEDAAYAAGPGPVYQPPAPAHEEPARRERRRRRWVTVSLRELFRWPPKELPIPGFW